jgi:transposase-like protein
MSQEEAVKLGTIGLREAQPGDEAMVSKERWETIRRLFGEQRLSVSEIARRLDVDRKTVRYWAQQLEWKPYERDRAAVRLLSEHEQFLRERAMQVNYSARILFGCWGRTSSTS